MSLYKRRGRNSKVINALSQIKQTNENYGKDTSYLDQIQNNNFNPILTND